MKCPQCGNEIREGKSFCNRCGAPAGAHPGGSRPSPPRDLLVILGIIAVTIAVAAAITLALAPPAAEPDRNAGETAAYPTVFQGLAPVITSPALKDYTNRDYGFSLKVPEGWQVSCTDYISIESPAGGNGPLLRIQPVHLSGQYSSWTAADLGNRVVPQLAAGYHSFNVDAVSLSQDRNQLDLLFSALSSGGPVKGVISIFTNRPYGILTLYQAPERDFSGTEALLRDIAGSYRQETPPAPDKGTAKGSGLGPLRQVVLDGRVSMLLPEGWTGEVLPGCAGIYVHDPARPGWAVLYTSGLHQGTLMLPPGVTPEQYLTEYFTQDAKGISQVRFLGYEPVDVSLFSGGGSDNAKAMKASFLTEGVPTTGGFIISTHQLYGLGTNIPFLLAISAPEGQYDLAAPTLVQILASVQYSEASLSACRQSLDQAWAAANRIGETIRSTGEQMRNENLQQFYNRMESQDQYLEKFSDVILDRDRVYNPETNEVYEVDPNFYQYYDLHREEWDYSQMRQLTNEEYTQYPALNPGRIH